MNNKNLLATTVPDIKNTISCELNSDKTPIIHQKMPQVPKNDILYCNTIHVAQQQMHVNVKM